MVWLWVVAAAVPFALVLAGLWVHFYLKRRFLPPLIRIFEEKPLFIIPRGQPVEDAEDVLLTTPDGLRLRGCYLRTTAPARRGVILFGLEFGSNRWACVPYCEFLRAAGFDVFAFEPRGQGDSDGQPGYEPLQWVTDFEVRDFWVALAYLKGRPDADPRGVGFFGISKGGTAGLLATADDPWVRCFVTDGIFATHTTMVPYMRKWLRIYSDRYKVQRLIPWWYFRLFARMALKELRRKRRCRFPHLEHMLPRLAPRPLLMIHGGGDTYIKPEMAGELFELAQPPKEFWLVEGAKHNQAFHLAGEEYRARVRQFFLTHLAQGEGPTPPPEQGTRSEERQTPVTASR